jgi:L-lactate dehydrogenase complex protein LldG
MFPLPEPNEAAIIERFRTEFEALLGEWRPFGSVADARRWLEDWWKQENFGSVLAPDCSRLRAVLDGLPNVEWITADNSSARGWERAALGVTPTLALVAESGTLVVGADISGRSMSLLPPVHLVIATRDEFVADLETAFERIRQRYPVQLPSTLSWISGPSRTADIEKILVLGAHGPRRLVLLVLPTESLPPI